MSFSALCSSHSWANLSKELHAWEYNISTPERDYCPHPWHSQHHARCHRHMRYPGVFRFTPSYCSSFYRLFFCRPAGHFQAMSLSRKSGAAPEYDISRMLETGLRRKKKITVNIFREWDAKIFPETDSSLAGVRSNKDDTSFKVLMGSVEADDTDEEGDGAIEYANN